jgi:hypothetical protein
MALWGAHALRCIGTLYHGLIRVASERQRAAGISIERPAEEFDVGACCNLGVC